MPQLRGQPLEFSATPVNRRQMSALVAQESGDPATFDAALGKIAGPNAGVTSTPVLLSNCKNGYGTANLFQVKGTDGQAYLMDSRGAHYTSFEDYLQNNELSADWRITRPANLGNPSGDVLMTTVGGVATGAAAGHQLFSRYQHGVDIFDSRSRGDWISVANGVANAAALGTGGVAAAGKTGAALVLGRVAAGAAAPLVANQGFKLYQNWDKLSPSQRLGQSAEIAAETGLLAAPFAAGKSLPQGEIPGAVQSGGAVVLDPRAVRLSQNSVKGAATIIDNMRANGWTGSPIDVVRMPDGGLTAIDNTRVVASGHAGIKLRAVIHSFDEPLPDQSQIDRFTTPKGSPSTWGDAISMRIGKEAAAYRNTYPMGSPWTGWDGN